MDAIRSVVARNVKRYREAAGLTQEQLGVLCNFHRTHISNIELNKVNVGLESLEAIARVLKIAPAILLMEQSPTDPLWMPGGPAEFDQQDGRRKRKKPLAGEEATDGQTAMTAADAPRESAAGSCKAEASADNGAGSTGEGGIGEPGDAFDYTLVATDGESRTGAPPTDIPAIPPQKEYNVQALAVFEDGMLTVHPLDDAEPDYTVHLIYTLMKCGLGGAQLAEEFNAIQNEVMENMIRVANQRFGGMGD